MDSKGYCWWWLRSPGYFQNDAVNVLADGDINRSGAEVDFNNFAVRPALWMKTGSQKKKADAEIAVNAELEQQEASAADKTSFPVIRKDVYFKFGSYFQKNSSEKTPIEWQVLKKTDSKALLISRYCLGRRQYHHEWADITWENSDLRKWLNGEFLQSAFSKEEQKKIAVTEIANDGNSRYGTDGGNITEDRIFCLSIEEAKSLFENDEVRKCGFVPKWWKSEDSCWWWLRSPGFAQDCAALVLEDGVLSLNGSNVNQTGHALRPALWVHLDFLEECENAVMSSDSADRSASQDLYEDDYCTFGSYCRKNDGKKVPIEWLVLKKSDSRVLLISRYGLDYKQYHHKCADITWEHCDLRKWLNGEFLKSSFSDKEQEAIQVTELANYDNTKYGTLGGNSTQDRIFCLSADEMNSLVDDDVRNCSFVPDATGKSEGCLWQLRSPGDCQNVAAGVDFDGALIMRGYRVDSACYALRPALWVQQDDAKTLRPIVNENCIRFGNYYRKKTCNKSPIEWLVLKRSGNRVLLISRYGLDCLPYHHEYVDITWENCDLRKWLNGEFFRNAFSEAEKKKIALTKLVNDNNPEHGTSGGNSTEDRVFCLSLEEAESLFEGDEARKCVPTSYAAEKGCSKSKFSLVDGRGCCSWWLRTPNRTQKDVLTTDEHGRLGSRTSFVRNIDSKNIAVRPVIWVNL